MPAPIPMSPINPSAPAAQVADLFQRLATRSLPPVLLVEGDATELGAQVREIADGRGHVLVLITLDE